MRKINYEKIIRDSVDPKLAYHGFKYDEQLSYAPQGYYIFSRTYWCASQRISFCRVEYDREAFIAQKNDCPTEVPRSLLLNQEPGFRLWLSNKYITASLESERRTVSMKPGVGINANGEPANDERFATGLRDLIGTDHIGTWWEFDGDADLRRVLSEIVWIVISEGLEWFEHQIADVRRYHEKLDKRREAVKK